MVLNPDFSDCNKAEGGGSDNHFPGMTERVKRQSAFGYYSLSRYS